MLAGSKFLSFLASSLNLPMHSQGGIVPYSIRSATVLAALFVGVFAAAGIHAQSYPAKPIRIVVGEVGGTAPDTVPRILAPHMGKILGQPIIVENRPGASSRIAYEYVATRADPDGYTIAQVSTVNLALLPLTVKGLNFDPVMDLPPAIGVADIELVVVTSSKSNWTTLPEALAYAKNNPGKLNFGSAAHSTRMAIELLIRGSGVNALVVPYTTGAQIAQGVLNGDVHLIFSSGLTVESFGDKARALAVTGNTRRAPFLAVPTLSELGFPKIRGVGYSLNVRTGTPGPVIERINAAASEALRNPEVQAQFAKMRLNIVNSSAEAATKAQTELAKDFAEVAREIGLKPE
jgi:tripartite-type tricarboxylate transporter receptor subunit TctC